MREHTLCVSLLFCVLTYLAPIEQCVRRRFYAFRARRDEFECCFRRKAANHEKSKVTTNMLLAKKRKNIHLLHIKLAHCFHSYSNNCLFIPSIKPTMGDKHTPSTFGEDDCGNDWGTGYVDDVYGVRSGGSKAMVQHLVGVNVPTYRLMTLVESGTTANDRAIDMSTDSNHNLCLFAMGSYVAGAGASQQWSTSKNIRVLALVCSPDECEEEKAQTNTIPFPYHVAGIGFDDDLLLRMEDACVTALQMKLTTALIAGKPFKALLFEYILSGNGGTLSDRFLLKLVPLLSRHKITVIADEIMTGGRVGPTLAMTSSRPKEFQALVSYITMGKSMRCGMVLDKVSLLRSDRGTSTEISFETVYGPLKAIIERAKSGVIEAKRHKVLKSMGLLNQPNRTWPDGGGLMIFGDLARHKVMKGLKNRYLPKLELSPKTRILYPKGTQTVWNKITVNQHLMEKCQVWIDHVYTMAAAEGSPYSHELVKYLLSRPLENRILHGSFLTYIGEHGNIRDAKELVDMHRARKKQRLGNTIGRCKKKHDNLVWEVLKHAAETSNGFITPSQHLTKRNLCYLVDYDIII